MIAERLTGTAAEARRRVLLRHHLDPIALVGQPLIFDVRQPPGCPKRLTSVASRDTAGIVFFGSYAYDTMMLRRISIST